MGVGKDACIILSERIWGEPRSMLVVVSNSIEHGIKAVIY